MEAINNKRVRVLQLDIAGQPQRWISMERAASLHFKDMVAWSISPENVVLRGGYSRITGEQSTLSVNTIIAVKGKIKTQKSVIKNSVLDNAALFARDQYICAYCGDTFNKAKLTRDHVVPTSRGGEDIWTNVVTACSPCNQKKSNKIVDGTNVKLLYVPYRPCHSEMLLISNKRNILACQMEFLMQSVKKQKISRLH